MLRSTVLILLLMTVTVAPGQKAFLVKGKKKVPLAEDARIGLTTQTDTIKYWDNGLFSYEIFKLVKDSLTVRRPDTFQDTVLLEKDFYDNRPGFDYLTDKCYKENRKRYCRIRKILSYQTKTFAYKDLFTLTYPTYTGSGGGCIFCILSPGLNIIWLIDILNRKEKKPDMKKWTIQTE